MARKERRANGNIFSRAKSKRESYDKVLIVCEDTKSAKYYLEGFVLDIGLSSANVKVVSGSGSAPINVVDTAISCSEPVGEDIYDQVYCVIDRDHHESFDRAIDKITRHMSLRKTKSKFYLIVSYPSFEIWVLYHGRYTSAHFEYCDDVIREIKKHYINDYDKSDRDIYDRTKSDISDAISNSKRSMKRVGDEGGVNPSTNMHTLIEQLKYILNPIST
ncbi:TPA: RloB domain-containing protein [Aeromonas salmonicida]|nr:RloB domain-containing protein [Aeromonas salmonicida]